MKGNGKTIRGLKEMLDTTIGLIADEEFIKRARMMAKHFTRERKIGFEGIVMFILGCARNTLQGALNTYIEKTGKMITYTKQAFSKARQRIKPEAFKEIFDLTPRYIYKKIKTRTYRKSHLIAIDGSKLNLPENEESRKIFGEQITGNAPQIQALASTLFDVLNGVIIDARFGSCRDSERRHAEDMIESFDSKMVKNPLFLFDRGYPSANLMELIENKGYHYIMRCDKTFLRSINVSEPDEVITNHFIKADKTLKFRLITVVGKNGEADYLITNILSKKYSIDDFVKLYHLRWGIETNYGTLKEKIQIENFTGSTPVAVAQDFYATLYLANLAAVVILDNRDEVEEKYNTPQKKYEYKTNINITLSSLKHRVVELFISRSSSRRNYLLDLIYTEVLNAVVPIKPSRSVPRVVRHSQNKFPLNKKNP